MPKAVIFDFSGTLYDPETEDLYLGVESLLKELEEKGYKLGLVTRTPTPGQRLEQIKKFGLEKYFKAVDIFEKDSAKDFNKIFTKLDTWPEETIIIGDRISSEILEGNRAGAITVWIRQSKYSDIEPQEKIEEPDYTIYKLDELLDILEDYEH